MNLIQLLSPKADVTYIYDHYSIPTAMQAVRLSGFTAVPVISDDGLYQGVISLGDFLWAHMDGRDTDKQGHALKLSAILNPEKYPAIGIGEASENVFKMAVNQNFVPVVDDRGMFIGIVTRKNVIEYFLKEASKQK